MLPVVSIPCSTESNYFHIIQPKPAKASLMPPPPSGHRPQQCLPALFAAAAVTPPSPFPPAAGFVGLCEFHKILWISPDATPATFYEQEKCPTFSTFFFYKKKEGESEIEQLLVANGNFVSAAVLSQTGRRPYFTLPYAILGFLSRVCCLRC